MTSHIFPHQRYHNGLHATTRTWLLRNPDAPLEAFLEWALHDLEAREGVGAAHRPHVRSLLTDIFAAFRSRK